MYIHINYVYYIITLYMYICNLGHKVFKVTFNKILKKILKCHNF